MRSYITTEGFERLQHKMYVALDLAPKPTKNIDKLARSNKAGFARIASNHDGDIPLDADWLRVAREINTALLRMLEKDECNELHLFPAMPVALAFALGMGLETRASVTVHQWLADGDYPEVIHLNRLIPGRG